MTNFYRTLFSILLAVLACLPATAAVANNPDEFDGALAAPNADWVYFRYLPPNKQVEALRRANKRAFIAGATVAGDLPKNWQQAADVGINGILTDYPFELAAMLRERE